MVHRMDEIDKIDAIGINEKPKKSVNFTLSTKITISTGLTKSTGFLKKWTKTTEST